MYLRFWPTSMSTPGSMRLPNSRRDVFRGLWWGKNGQRDGASEKNKSLGERGREVKSVKHGTAKMTLMNCGIGASVDLVPLITLLHAARLHMAISSSFATAEVKRHSRLKDA